jgi:hypothetical protein
MARLTARRLSLRACLATIVCAWAAAGCAQGAAVNEGWPGASTEGGSESDGDAPNHDAANPTTGDATADTTAPPPASDAGTEEAGNGGDGAEPADSSSATDTGGLDAGDDGTTADASVDSGSPPDGSPHDAHPPDAATCTDNLSGIGTGNFHLSVTITTTQAGPAALLNQRSTCGHGMFWDLRTAAGGTLQFETDDGTTYVALACSHVVNDGSAHAITVARVSKSMTIAVDGTPCASGTSATSFAQLPPLEKGVDPCDGHTSTMPFSGTMANPCVTPQ